MYEILPVARAFAHVVQGWYWYSTCRTKFLPLSQKAKDPNDSITSLEDPTVLAVLDYNIL